MKPAPDVTQGRLPGILEAEDFGVPVAELSDAALRVLESRYLLRNEKGEIIESPRQLFLRVAYAIAAVEPKHLAKNTAKNFFELLANLKFLPNSPTLMNAGKATGQLSACFVLPLEDDLSQIFQTLRESAIIHKTGGGTGFNFSSIRPAGDFIKGSGGKASGPIAFLKIFDMVTNTVKQGGIRRGANMAILDAHHPDIESFIQSKTGGGIENFNISVAVPDSFMDAVSKNTAWLLINPRTGAVVKKISARKLWKSISKSAWNCGDPGVVFIDRVNEVNPTPDLGPMISTNPCGEQPLLGYESCNLGSINLLAYARENDFDWSELEKDVPLCVRFLDNVIDANNYLVKEIEKITKANRKIGLGVMGWADVLMKWQIPYDSDHAIALAERAMARIQELAVKASEDLAAERGEFLNYKNSLWAKKKMKPRRNATVTTVAPTGTISIIAGVSSGIEPVFSLAYERIALEGEKLIFIHPLLRKALRDANIRSRKVLLKVLESGSVSKIEDLPKKSRSFLKTAPEISPLWHVRMQAAFQKFTENAVSKTINLPFETSAAQIQKIYEKAYELGCKGITVFRDTSKKGQVLRTGVGKKKKELVDVVDWLLDDGGDQDHLRKRASVDLATLSRAQIKKQDFPSR